MTTLLRALVLALWSCLAPGLERSADARAIASAAVDAVLEDGGKAPVFGSHRPYGTQATSGQMGRRRVARARELLVQALARVD